MSRRFDWRQFHHLTAGSSPWPTLVRAVDLLGHAGDALDVGSGAGRDTAHLLRAGFYVTAVDSAPSAAEAMRRMPRQRQLRFVQVPLEDFEVETYDLVNAQFALPFVTLDAFDGCVQRLVDSVRPGGVLVASFLGPNDSWNVPGSGLNFTSAARVRELLATLDLVEFEDEDRDGETADGSRKHWHVCHVIARRTS